MGLGREWEPMAHQYLSEQLTNHEIWQEREAALRRRGETAMYLASVDKQFREARDAGNITPELWKAYNNAQVDEISATGWLLQINRNIREMEL